MLEGLDQRLELRGLKDLFALLALFSFLSKDALERVLVLQLLDCFFGDLLWTTGCFLTAVNDMVNTFC